MLRFLSLLLVAGLAAAQSQCLCSDGSVSASVDFSRPAKILFIMVGPDFGLQWQPKILAKLQAISSTYPQFSVDVLDWRRTVVSSFAPFPADISSYTQIWIYDIEYQLDSTLTAQYTTTAHAITAWAGAGGIQSLNWIFDGRLASEIWRSSNQQTFTNYAVNIHKRGRGVVVATDNDPFFQFVNGFGSQLGFSGFSGNIGITCTDIDVGNPLFSFPAIPSDPNCGAHQIRSDSTTSQAPSQLQSNGISLNPAGYYPPGTTSIAVSTSLRGSVGFVIGITQPTCNSVLATGSANSFVAAVLSRDDNNLNVNNYQWTWSSTVDGAIGTGASITATLSAGHHSVSVVARDSTGRSVSATVCVCVGTQATCYPQSTTGICGTAAYGTGSSASSTSQGNCVCLQE